MFKEITLKTRIKTPARKESRANFLKLLRIALKMLASSFTYVKISKRWIVYHYTPMKLPMMAAATNIRMERNPAS